MPRDISLVFSFSPQHSITAGAGAKCYHLDFNACSESLPSKPWLRGDLYACMIEIEKHNSRLILLNTAAPPLEKIKGNKNLKLIRTYWITI